MTLYVSLLVLAAALLGGGNIQGLPGDALLVMASIPLLAWMVAHHIQRGDALVLLPVLATLAVPLFQLIPWPHDAFPGAEVHRNWQIDQLLVFGIDTPRTLSLAPDATWRTLLNLLPPLAVLLAVLALPERQRQWIAKVVIAAALLNAVWAIVQVGVGNRVDISFHAGGRAGVAQGFFSNRNHFAALMYTGMALTGMYLLLSIRRMTLAAEPSRLAPAVIGWSLALFLLLGPLMLSQSRGGVIIGAVVLLALLASGLYSLGRAARGGRRWFVVAMLTGVVVALQWGLWGVLARFELDPLDDARIVIHRVTWDAAVEAAPWGTGLGSFRRVYEQREPLEALRTTYVNRAHNDWLELYLEAGWAVGAVIVLWLGWWLWRFGQHLVIDAGHGLPLRLAATLGFLAVCMHSLADFPVRTSSVAIVTSILLAMTIRSSPRA